MFYFTAKRLHNREMMRQPRVPILIDTFNYGHFIEEAIESVLAQDFPPNEQKYLVVDDGSTMTLPNVSRSMVRGFGTSISRMADKARR